MEAEWCVPEVGPGAISPTAGFISSAGPPPPKDFSKGSRAI